MVRSRHLREFCCTLQADAYAGFNQLYENGRIQEAACWAHVRRKFYDLQQAHASPTATEALERIGALYAIEKEIRGGHRKNAARSAKRDRSRCSLLCTTGSRRRCQSFRASRIRPRR